MPKSKIPRSRASLAALEAAQPLPTSNILDELPQDAGIDIAQQAQLDLPIEGPEVFVGVDGGGSKTRVVIADASGTVLGRGEAGGSNINFVGEAAVRAALSDAWRAAWRDAGKPPRPATAAYLGLAGVSAAGAHETVRLIASQIGFAEPDAIGVGHDISAALAGAFRGGAGLALVVGTGSSCFGRNSGGTEAQSGGFGPVIDDGGSGYWLGRMALRATVFASDGRAPETALSKVVFEHLGISDTRGITQKLYREHIAREVVAALAPKVIEAAVAGDPVAVKICEEGAESLAEMVGAVSRRLCMPDPSIAIIGSAGRHPFYLERITAAIRSRFPGATVATPALEPEKGALILAFRHRNLQVPAALQGP